MSISKATIRVLKYNSTRGKSKNEVELNEKMYSADHDLDLDHEADKSGMLFHILHGVRILNLFLEYRML